MRYRTTSFREDKLPLRILDIDVDVISMSRLFVTLFLTRMITSALRSQFSSDAPISPWPRLNHVWLMHCSLLPLLPLCSFIKRIICPWILQMCRLCSMILQCLNRGKVRFVRALANLSSCFQSRSKRRLLVVRSILRVITMKWPVIVCGLQSEHFFFF